MATMNLPIEIIIGAGVVIVVLFMATVFLGMYWSDMRTKNPELHVFQNARKKPFPDIVALIDLSGRYLFFNGEKNKPYDVKLKKDDYGLLLDSRLASKRPRSRMEDGTSFMCYGTNFHFPLDPNGARGIVQLIHKIRKEYKQLNFIRDDIVLLELLGKSGEDLPHDLKEVIEMYPLEAHEVIEDRDAFGNIKKIDTEKHDVETLVKLFEEIKGNLKGWKVEPGFFNMKEALELLPIGTTSTDMKRVETITKINTQNEMRTDQHSWENTAKFFCIIMGAIVICWMIISAMKPGGG